MPLLHSGTQRNHEDFSSDVPSNAVLVWHQMQNFFWKIMVVVVFGPSLKMCNLKGIQPRHAGTVGFSFVRVDTKGVVQQHAS